MKIKMILRIHVSSKINEAVLFLLVLERFLSRLPPSAHQEETLRWLGGHAEGCHLTTCPSSPFLSMAVEGSVPKPSLTRSKPLGWLKSGPALKHRGFYLQRRRLKTGLSFVFLCLLPFPLPLKMRWKCGVLKKTGNVTPRAVNSQELTDTTENTLGG